MSSAVPMGVLAAIAVKRNAQESEATRFVQEEDVRRFAAPTAADSRELVRPLLEGNAEAWRKFVSLQHQRIYSLSYRFTGDATIAEDLTQEIFLKFYGSLKTYDPSKQSLTAWVTTIARNVLVDTYRTRRANPPDDDDYLELVPTLALPQITPNREMLEKVRDALGSLPKDLSETVSMYHIEGMKVAEISEVTKVSAATVRRRLAKGRAQLAKLLPDLGTGIRVGHSEDETTVEAITSEGHEAEQLEEAQATILRRAVEVIGGEAEAMRWMGTPVRALDYATPVSLLHNQKGFEAVQLVLGRLEHGIL